MRLIYFSLFLQEVKIAELNKNIEGLSSDSTGQAQLLADKDNSINSLQAELKNLKNQKVT